jgi:threonine dehydratase
VTIFNIHAAVLEADRRIRPQVVETPLRHSPHLSRRSGAEVYCKLENLQITGSFKARGAANKLAMLSAEERSRGVVTASSGNHGAAVAAMLAKMGGRCLVFAPATTPGVKIDAIRNYGSDLHLEGDDSGICEVLAREHAAKHGLAYVSPYNDAGVIAGQGTIAAEISRQAPEMEMIVASVGGGGLISGIAGFIKQQRPGTRIVGASPVNDHSMRLSAGEGRAVAHEDARPTLSDGTAGSVEPGAITVNLCKELVDDWPLASEDEIAAAMRAYMTNDYQLIEGAAGVAIAGFLNLAADRPELVKGRKVVIVICGARIDLAKLAKVIAQ